MVTVLTAVCSIISALVIVFETFLFLKFRKRFEDHEKNNVERLHTLKMFITNNLEDMKRINTESALESQKRLEDLIFSSQENIKSFVDVTLKEHTVDLNHSSKEFLSNVILPSFEKISVENKNSLEKNLNEAVSILGKKTDDLNILVEKQEKSLKEIVASKVEALQSALEVIDHKNQEAVDSLKTELLSSRDDLTREQSKVLNSFFDKTKKSIVEPLAVSITEYIKVSEQNVKEFIEDKIEEQDYAFEEKTKQSLKEISEKSIKAFEDLRHDHKKMFDDSLKSLRQVQFEHEEKIKKNNTHLAANLAVVLEARISAEEKVKIAQENIKNIEKLLVEAKIEAAEAVERARHAAEAAEKASIEAEESARKVRSLPRSFGPSEDKKEHLGFMSKTGSPFDKVDKVG